MRSLPPGGYASGQHEIQWDRRSRDGEPAQPGVYFVGVRAGAEHITRRIVLVR